MVEGDVLILYPTLMIKPFPKLGIKRILNLGPGLFEVSRIRALWIWIKRNSFPAAIL